MPTKDEIMQFSQTIENLALNEGFTLLDAIVYHCGDIEMEVEVAATLISPALKQKIKEEAEDNNLLKKTSKLPI